MSLQNSVVEKLDFVSPVRGFWDDNLTLYKGHVPTIETFIDTSKELREYMETIGRNTTEFQNLLEAYKKWTSGIKTDCHEPF